jgi:hypothetical protein
MSGIGGFNPTYAPMPTEGPETIITYVPTPTYANAYTYTYTPTPVPRSMPNGYYLVDRMNGGPGQLDIDNGLSKDAVIVLVKTYDPGYVLMSVYVKANSMYTATGIDDGTYYIYYMTGVDWDDESHTFTRSASYERYEDEFDFTNYDWEIGLKPVEGGNADTLYVSENNFPSM